MDVVFAGLRTMSPTEEEIVETKKATFVLETLWRNLELSITPKAHILFEHAVPQFEALGGIADKVEDFVEKSHQEGKRLDNLTSRMPSQCYRQQQLVQIQRLWRSNHPNIIEAIKKVRTFSKRNFKATSRKQTSSTWKNKKSRYEIREVTKDELLK